MCGIMGYIGSKEAWAIVMAGLKRLEYRGYDSAGIATLHRGRLRVAKRVGHISALEDGFPTGLSGRVGIGHTRWATHGGVTEANCHPHLDPRGEIAVVHNGIIDNAADLRAELQADGAEFASETDTELLAHLIAGALGKDRKTTLVDAVRHTLGRVQGTAGLVVMHRGDTERLVAARLGSPVVVGIGDGEMFVASDQLALVPFTDRMVVLDEGEIADITPAGLKTVDFANRDRAKRVEAITAHRDDVALGEHPDYMSKEIAEQPAVIERTIRGRTDLGSGTAKLGGLDELGARLFDVDRVVLLGAGTSLHCAQVARHLLEALARIPAHAEDAAEFANRNPIVDARTLYVAVSQSGETADTLVAVREIQQRGGTVVGITNGVGSTLARETDCGVYVHAGPEISVCSTKAFTAQVIALTLLALRVGRTRHVSAAAGRELVQAMQQLPELVTEMLAHAALVKDLAYSHTKARYAMFVGRGVSVAVAREGALKLKEIGYIPSDGLSGAQMKHGPLALIEAGTPVWALVPPDEHREAMLNNMQELNARGARLFAVADPDDDEVRALAHAVVPLPKHHRVLSPVLTTVPLQQYAYFTALALGHDIDKPRNLAKAVTVL